MGRSQSADAVDASVFMGSRYESSGRWCGSVEPAMRRLGNAVCLWSEVMELLGFTRKSMESLDLEGDRLELVGLDWVEKEEDGDHEASSLDDSSLE